LIQSVFDLCDCFANGGAQDQVGDCVDRRCVAVDDHPLRAVMWRVCDIPSADASAPVREKEQANEIPELILMSLSAFPAEE